MINEIFFTPHIYDDSFCVQLEVKRENEHIKYFGFGQCSINSLTDAKFAICRFHTDLKSGITTKMWANGTRAKQLPFENVENYNYFFLK